MLVETRAVHVAVALSSCKRSSPDPATRNVSIGNTFNTNNSTRSERGSLMNSLSSFRRSSKSELSDDSDDDQRDFHDLAPCPSVGGRRRSSLLMMRLSSISGRRGSNYSSNSSGVGGNDSPGRRSSAVNRKSSLDLLRSSGGRPCGGCPRPGTSVSKRGSPRAPVILPCRRRRHNWPLPANVGPRSAREVFPGIFEENRRALRRSRKARLLDTNITDNAYLSRSRRYAIDFQYHFSCDAIFTFIATDASCPF